MPIGVRVIDEISQQADVVLSNLQNNDILSYNSILQKWQNKVFSSGSGNQLSKTFTYDLDGRLSVITDSAGTKTLQYSLDGKLSQIIGTGSYPTKTFTYDINDYLISITIS